MANVTPDTKDEQDAARAPDAVKSAKELQEAEQKSAFDAEFENPERLNKDGVSGDLSGGVRRAEDNPNKPGEYINKWTGGGGSGMYVKKRNKKPLIAIILTILLGGGGGAAFFIGPALAPLSAIENITKDLNDQLTALDTRAGFMFRNKLPSADRKKALTGCTKLSIRCKFASLSNSKTGQVAKLKEVGITANTSTDSKFFGTRIQPDSYTFRNVTYSAEEWDEQLRTNGAAKNAQRRANNMTYLGMSDTVFTRVMARFGISKKPPELKGSTKDRVNALLTRAGAADTKSLTFSPVTVDGEEKFKLDGDESGRTYTLAERDKMQRSIERVANAKPPSKATKASIGALSVLGYWDLACSIKNMIGGASVAAKVANQAELIQYAMPVASLVSQLKAGDITAEDGEALGEFFAQTDSRRTIPNIEKSVTNTSDVDGGGSTIADELATMPNPNYGKNGMDSELQKMSALGGVAAPSTNRSALSLGMGQNQLLAGISGFAAIASALTNVGDANACAFVQSFAVRLVGGAVGLAVALGSAGGSLAVQVVVAGGMMAAIMVLDTVINNALAGSLIDNAELADAPVDRVDALWTGLSGILGNSAQQRGLMPGTSEQIVEYAQLQNETNQDYIALETENVNQLDIYSQYSFLGSFARSINGYSNSTVSVGSLLGNISSIVKGGIGSFATISSAYAAPIDQSRFKQCDDAGYAAIGIDADVQCNVRYIMPTADLQMDTDEVAVYMEQNNYVEADTTTGFPVGYTPPNPSQSQNAAMDYISGVADSFVNQRSLPNDYARFLDYCVYRTLPFGETFEEGGSINDDPLEWKNGANCLKTGVPYNYFRIYTLDKSVSDAIDGVGEDESAFNTTNVPNIITNRIVIKTTPSLVASNIAIASASNGVVKKHYITSLLLMFSGASSV